MGQGHPTAQVTVTDPTGNKPKAGSNLSPRAWWASGLYPQSWGGERSKLSSQLGGNQGRLEGQTGIWANFWQQELSSLLQVWGIPSSPGVCFYPGLLGDGRKTNQLSEHFQRAFMYSQNKLKHM